MATDIKTMAHLSRHPEVYELLFKTLPAMQPSALKHEYLASVANVLNNPVAEHISTDDSRYIIGFADIERTLPLMLVVEAEPNNTVRHAFPPSVRQDPDYDLIKKLDAHDRKFAEANGLKPRNVFDSIRKLDREWVNSRGIPPYDPIETFTGDRWLDYRQNFYSTRLMPTSDAFDHKPIMYDTDGDDYWKMIENITTHINHVDPTVGVRGLELDTYSPDPETTHKTMHAKNIGAKIDPNDHRPPMPYHPTKRVRSADEMIHFDRSPARIDELSDRIALAESMMRRPAQPQHDGPAY